jgi:DNA-directed RNA polymerase specialized sigma24 family protein
MTRKQFDIPAPKTALTPTEQLKAAYLHLVEGHPQHTLAQVFGVNQGRVNEAVLKVRRALLGEEA